MSARALRRAVAPDLNWTIAEVIVVLLWKLRPRGLKLTKKDLGGLPRDRVLLEDRRPDRILYRWETPDQAVYENALRAQRGEEKPGLYEAQGRYMKLLGVILWKLAKDGITLGVSDRDAVPADKVLRIDGTADRVIWTFVSRGDAERLSREEKEHRGLDIVEAIRR